MQLRMGSNQLTAVNASTCRDSTERMSTKHVSTKHAWVGDRNGKKKKRKKKLHCRLPHPTTADSFWYQIFMSSSSITPSPTRAKNMDQQTQTDPKQTR